MQGFQGAWCVEGRICGAKGWKGEVGGGLVICFLSCLRVGVAFVKGDEFVPTDLVRMVGEEAGARHGDKIHYEAQLGISNNSVECKCTSHFLIFFD